jgi:1-deoxy-D-xylulose-5-phosphate reductoisomerase
MADRIKSVSIFGATGSIGSSALDLISRFPEGYRAHVLTAGRDAKALGELALKFKPQHIGLADADGHDELKDVLDGADVEIHIGAQAIADLAAIKTDLVISAITGIAGLMPTLAAVKAGHVVAIANKEALVTAGHIIMEAAQKHGATLLPVDSEHNAIFQAWTSPGAEDIHSITLTASGGPFLKTPLANLVKTTPAQALKHPKWSMGPKISVDSATMMNKGFEVIEAAVLFDLPEDRIKTLIHPESVVHGMVHYQDGTTLAQMCPADMRVPISYVLAWPERMNWGAETIDLVALDALEFSHPEADRFPCLDLARQAAREGGLATTVLNASNEKAVDYFLEEKVSFLDIAALNTHMLDHIEKPQLTGLDDILAKDEEVRRKCDEWLQTRI